ncbi:MAG: AzlC family ABC transporter permease [Clostridia bacterium]|nr:AzlC family ABC transporter permease [Clostridia bacterium]
MKINNSFIKGMLDGMPICIGYLSVSFAFGIMAVQCGLSPLEALLISMTNLTSAGQMAGTPIIAAGGSFIELAMTQLIINSRYALMSVALSQKLDRSVTTYNRLLIAFGNTDEIFAVSMGKEGSVGKRYFYGLILTPWLGWSLGTILGAVCGAILPAVVSSALSVAIYAMLIAIVVPKMREHVPTAWCVGLSVILCCAFKYLPLLAEFAKEYSGFVIIICAVVSSLLFALLFPIENKEVE